MIWEEIGRSTINPTDDVINEEVSAKEAVNLDVIRR